jgi:pimeloyl-ACP methyl ester carboxylesterase
LFVRGERSDYVLPEHRAAVGKYFPAAKQVTLRGAGHWLHADAPEAFASVVEPFIN